MKVDNIIRFWSDSNLANQYSSTYSSNYEFLDYLDSVAQVKFLSSIIKKHFGDNPLNVLDVGAGLGRLSIPLAKMGHYVVALEPAESLYEQLLDYCPDKELENLECISELFENYEAPSDFEFDVIIFSGVLYFYDDSSLARMIDRTQHLLSRSGVIVVRDSFSKDNVDIESRVINGARCRYRPFSFWGNMLSDRNMKIIHEYAGNPKRYLQKRIIHYGTRVFGSKFGTLTSRICTSSLSITLSYLIRLTRVEKYLRYDLMRHIYPSMIAISRVTR
jgi:SAM-dependent methyltransferase